MRSFHAVGLSLALLLTAACDGDRSAPGGHATGAAPGVHATAPAPLASIVFESRGKDRRVLAVLEDGSRDPVVLSAPRTVASFAGALPGQRALIATHAPDGSIEALHAASVVDGTREAIAELPAGRWDKVVQTKLEGDAYVLELGRVDEWGKSDVVSLHAGGAPLVVAENATLVAAAAGRIAYKLAGDLASALLDGGDVKPLGGGDAQDHVMDVRGDRVLLTLHDGGVGDVRVVTLDGKVLLDLGAPGVDDRAFAFAGDDRVLLTRAAGGPRSLVSAALDGTEAAIASSGADASPIAITPGGQLLFTDGDALAIAASTGGAARLLDPTAGASMRFGKVERGMAFFTGGPSGNALRSAKLDGSGVTELCHELTWLPFFSTVTTDGRAVFYRALLGQIEGGRLYGVNLDGTDMQPVASEIANPDGSAFGAVAADQDFEAVTPSGRLVLEAEFEGPSHLLVSPGGAAARRLADLSQVKFAALVVE